MSNFNLNDYMEFDSVVMVFNPESDPYAVWPEPDHTLEDGLVIGRDAEMAPDVYAEGEGETRRLTIDGEGWELLSGFTGQWGYNGPEMHPSEYIGGGLAEHILSTPGMYCAVVVYETDDSEPESWAVAYRPID